MIQKILFSLFLILTTQYSFSQCEQAPTGDKKLAKQYMSYGQYTCALNELLHMHHRKPKNRKINFQIAECYLNIEGDKSKAIEYLEFVIKQRKFDDDALYMLGKAYHYAYRFDDAISMLNRFLATGPNSDAEFATKEYIQYAKNAKELTKFKANIKFENLGEDVNTEWNEFTPYTNPEEEFIIFSTNRERTMGNYPYGDGFLTDVYSAKYRSGDFVRSRSIGGIFNSMDLDEVAGGSADGKVFFIATDTEYQIFNLKMSVKGPRNRSYPRPEFLEEINGKNSNELCATITNDGSILIFSSDREGGYGGFDLWMSKKLPNDKWGIPINLGPEINTEMDEFFPMFSHDQKSITFSSNGHYTMGGLDLFETTFSEELKTWTAPKNLGYPVNTVFDDYNIIKTPSERYAYKSLWMEDSYGMNDIYRLTFMDSTPLFTIINSKIVKPESITLKENQLDSAYLAIKNQLENQEVDKKTKENLNSKLLSIANEKATLSPFGSKVEVHDNSGNLIGKYSPDITNGEFSIVLEPGSYVIKISHENYQDISENITIYDKNGFSPLLTKEFTLLAQ